MKINKLPRNIIRITSLIFSIITVSIVVNLIIIGAFTLANIKNVSVDVSSYSDALILTESGYLMEQEVINRMEKNDYFALLLDGNGTIIWEYNKPAEIPEKYSIQDVASFSRWYLKDYPVKIWTKNDGLFILGEPKDSMWKYPLDIRMSQMNVFLWIMPLTIFCNFLVVFFVCFKMTKKWQKERDVARTEWISCVSHDIRTPLSMVLGYASTLEKDVTLSENQKQQAIIIRRQSEKMRKFITDINLVNRLEFSKDAIDLTKFSVTSLIREVVAETINSDINQNYLFTLDFTDNETFLLQGDSDLFIRLIQNLIGNSIKHNPLGCKIFISAHKHDKNIYFQVADNGCAFQEKSLTLLNSSSFDQYLKPTTEHGLGLKIVKKIVKLHHGEIEFSNNKHGGASSAVIFTVE